MRALGVLFSIVLVVGALAGTVWVTRYAPWVEPAPMPILPLVAETPVYPTAAETSAEQAAKTAEPVAKPEEQSTERVDPDPPMAAKGPYPKAVTGERTFEFGTMAIDQERSHKFTISNKGESPLLLARGETQCKCTLSALKRVEVPPGESSEVELSWTPREAGVFEKYAKIKTNDPDNREIKFHILGKVEREFVVSPEHTWDAGQVTDTQPGSVTGEVCSAIDKDFKILSVTPAHPLMTVKYHPLSRKEASRRGMLAGYEFDVNVAAGIPLGEFRARLRIKTDLGLSKGDEKEIDIEVKANRSGPILYLPPIGSGQWYGNRSTLTMGRFNRKEGRKVILPVLIYQLPEDFKFVSVDSDTPFLKLTVERKKDIGTEQQKGYNFVFEVPPDSPAVNRINPNPSHITVKTNHPKMPEMKFIVEFLSL